MPYRLAALLGCWAGSLLLLAGCQLKTPGDHAAADAPLDSIYSADYETDVPYVPTPEPVVNRMLEMAQVSSEDVVYDLGSGDGRIVLTAIQRFDAKRGVGIEIVPEFVEKARSYASLAGVTDRVTFRRADLYKVDLHDATVVAMYLYPDVINDIWPKLMRQLDPGDRIVSHEYTGGVDPSPNQTVRLDDHMIHLWIVPDTLPDGVAPADSVVAADSLAQK